MPFDWSEYLKLAKELLENSDIVANEESKRRSTISRAYYFSFGFARKFLKDMYGEDLPEEGSVHSFVIRSLKEKPENELVRAGTRLENLKDNRIKADYKDEVTGLKRLADLSILDAEQVRDSINTQS